MKTIQRGFSLVELMIAMTIALIATLAATQIYASTRQTYRLQSMQNRLSDDGRFALSMLRRVFLQAGFQPNPASTRDNAFGNTKFLTPTSANSVTIRFISDGRNFIGCDGAVIANETNIQALTIGRTQGTNTLSCSSTGAANAVDWIAPEGKSSELVDLKFEYGTDTAPDTPVAYGCGANAVNQSGNKVRDCVADQYTQDMATNNPDNIVAVKVCLVLRTEEIDLSINRSDNYRNCSDAGIDGPKQDRRLYRTFRSTILLRN